MREEEKNRSSQDSKLKRFFKKRWVFPAVYIASAALILTAVLWYQSSTDNAIDSDKFDYNATDVPGGDFKNPAIEVNRSFENVVLPLTETDRDRAVIQKKFYDDNANAEEQEAALVVYQNQYHPNTGIDITVKDSEAFDVVAALSGIVTKVEEDAFLGNVIVIEHEDDIVTQYQSVKDIKVKVGDEIEQGQALATAGQSVFNEEAGVHVHFEIRKNGVPVNPESYLNKPLNEIQESDATKEEADKKEAADQEDATGDNGVSEEEEAELQDDSTKDDTGSEGQKDATDDQSDSEEPKAAPSDDNADKKGPDETTNNTQNKDA